VWQFIASTGKNYGLTIDDWVDERRDPIKATRAAARYLKDLHKMFGDWALALAAYNCGENCVARAISSCGQKDFWKLALPGETTAYVPKFFAAALIARDPEMYGLFIQPEPPLELAQIELRGVVELKALADFLGVSYEDLKAVNPELLGTHTPPSANSYKINVPRAQADACNMKLAAVTPGQLYLDEKQVSALKKPEGSAGGTIVYRVKRGDTLSSIAKRYRTTIAAIKRQNPKVGKYLKAGMQLRIPVGKKR
jgi:membrane-bound lytic murein transglycosylase D